MGTLGCPSCGRTPVIYVLSTKIWQCRHCRHAWREEGGKKEPVYFIGERVAAARAAAKPSKLASAPKPRKAAKKATPVRKPVKKAAKARPKKPSRAAKPVKKAGTKRKKKR